jgi:hypothetical protein
MDTKQVQRTDLEQIQEDAQSPDVDVSVERRDISGASELQSELGAMADSMDVTGFKCVHEKCGLVHGHDTTKHRAGDSFDMSDSEAAEMEANSVCHCGLNDAARSGVEGAPSPSQANSRAPIPDTMTRHLDQSL